ncbi:MAG: Mrp/NBP35 family ATP-binding protein [Actinomycetota bacterium]|nr:Mrp/NBP35 family ATP-binding protein [Acidimicrobiales bacterium]MEC8921943.1 Mrp/NBP35 family ATP-binding protein [Actinomycetota bacterium]MEC9316049.1 Mrp/NBP35 family ATP-binding protein [Actinomycetota bacterium]MED5553010.1 Mrp/NBP35 family ATP-binding protein [Actinomycetota bacterium]
MVTSGNELTEIVGRVVEPELRRDLHTMGMLREVSLTSGTVHVVVALPSEDWPATETLTNLIETSIATQEGVKAVSVEFTVMGEAEQAAVREQLIGDPSSSAGTQQTHGHAEGRAIPFAEAGNSTRVLLIASGKGGVGKSSVTANLAIALAQRGLQTAIVDADVWGFSIPRMLGVERPPTVIDQMVVPVEANGVRCISMGFFAREDQPVIWRGPMLHKALEQFLTDVHWDDPDYLLVDLPPGTGDISLSLSQFLPKSELLVVTTPQPAAQKVAQRAAFMAEKVNLTVRAVIENMSWFRGDDGKRYEIFGSGGGEALAEELGVPLLGQIPLVPELREGGDVGRPITVADPTSETATIFGEMARLLTEEYLPTRRYNEGLKLV